MKSSFLDEFLDSPPFVRMNLQVIFNQHYLAVQDKTVVLITFKKHKKAVHEVNKFFPENLESLVPFSIPVGMGNNENRKVIHARYPPGNLGARDFMCILF